MCPAQITAKSKTSLGRSTDFSVNFVEDPSRLNKHIIAVEDGKPVVDLICKNLAAAIGASLFRMPVTKESAAADLALLYTWANHKEGLERQDARDALFESIKHRTGSLIDSKPETLTFFTNGTPYGVYPFACPTTHFFTYPLLGISLFSGIAKTIIDALRCPICVLIDPKALETTEFDAARAAFLQVGYMLRAAAGPYATAQAAHYLTAFLPCDAIFYSSHCGEVEGRRVTATFKTANDQVHEFIYDETVNAIPLPGSEKLEIYQHVLPVSIDGVSWTDNERKAQIKAGDVFEYFMGLKRIWFENPDVISIKHSEPSMSFASRILSE